MIRKKEKNLINKINSSLFAVRIKEQNLFDNLSGTWDYSFCASNIIDAMGGGVASVDHSQQDMPRHLFFSNNGGCTDGENDFSIISSFNYITKANETNGTKYYFLLQKNQDRLILFKELNEKNTKKMIFYVYNSSHINNKPLNANDLLEIKRIKSFQKEDLSILKDKGYNNEFEGFWNFYTIIKGKDLSKFKGEKDDKQYNLYWLADFLEFHGRDVYVQKAGEENDIQINRSGETIILTREKTKLNLFNYGYGDHNRYIVYDNSIKANQELFYKKIRGEEYIFIDRFSSLCPFDCVEIYVYKKVKNEQ